MSQAMNDLRGSLVALVTPMTASGAIDWAALDSLVDWHLESGTHGIVPVGTTGESATLTHAEHKQVIAAVVRRVDGRVPVVAGTGANATAEAIEFTRAAQGDGADYCLSVTPYYNKPTQEGLYRHYCAIAEAVDLADGSLQCAAAHGVRHAGCDRGPVVCCRFDRRHQGGVWRSQPRRRDQGTGV